MNGDPLDELAERAEGLYLIAILLGALSGSLVGAGIVALIWWLK